MELNEALVESATVDVGRGSALKKLGLDEPTLGQLKAIAIALKPHGVEITFDALMRGDAVEKLLKVPLVEIGPHIVGILLDSEDNRAAIGKDSAGFRAWVEDACTVTQAIDAIKALGRLPIFASLSKSLGTLRKTAAQGPEPTEQPDVATTH